MTIRLRIAELVDSPVSFGCSPAHELLRSLGVLAGVRRHPLHISWALRMRARLTPQIKDGMERYAFWLTDRPLVFRDIWPQAEMRAWVDELAALRAAPVSLFAEQLIHSALMDGGLGRRTTLDMFRRDSELQERAVSRIATNHDASVPVLRELIDDPERCRASFADFLESYWDCCLSPDWSDMQEHLRNDIARRGRAESRRGLPLMLEELSPHIRLDPATGAVVVRPPGRPGDADPVEVVIDSHDQILLLPSHFVWPELVAVVQRDRRDGRERQTVVITYALAEMQSEGRAPVPPEDLLKLLRAAGDPTRLQVLRLLARRSRSTRELAGLIGLTEAAISKHLKVLQDAGWVVPERQSYYVYYRLARESITDLSHGLEQLLG